MLLVCMSPEELARQKIDALLGCVGRLPLNLGEIKSSTLPLPSLAEQVRIVAEVERRFSVVEELEATVAANLQRAARLRQAGILWQTSAKLR